MKISIKFIKAAIILFTFYTESEALIRYVSPSGGGTFSGLSWSNAMPGSLLQSAINSSSSGDEVWVSAGIYITTTTVNRNISFNMRNGVIIYGSFTGTETVLSQRVFSCGPSSILSGEIGAAGIFDNSYHVISNSNLNSSAVIDGFVIRGANDNRAATFTNGLGGGIYNNGGNAGGICSPVIRNCLITNNQAVFGAGIFNSGHSGGNSNPLIINCIIANNNALDGGGGIDNFGLGGNASPFITNCLIYGNTANTGGGMYCWGGNLNGNSNPVILNSIFAGNRALAGNAGGIIVDNSNSSGSGNSGTSNVTVRNSILWDNTASLMGPQFYIKGTGIFTAVYSDINLTNQNPPHIISGAGIGNINSDPMFLNATNASGADNCYMTADDGLTFLPSSPCINSGNNTGVAVTDLLFNPRIFNTTVDMGAYEYREQNKTLFLTAYIQGFYNETFNNTVRDTLKINIRSGIPPYVSADSGTAFINTDGSATVNFNNAFNNTSYYLQIRHRNSVEVWSAVTVTFTNDNLNYDFTSSSAQAYGNNMSQIDSSPLRYGIYSGDVNQDGIIDAADISIIENDAANSLTGYVSSDLTGDDAVDASDISLVENNAVLGIQVIIP